MVTKKLYTCAVNPFIPSHYNIISLYAKAPPFFCPLSLYSVVRCYMVWSYLSDAINVESGLDKPDNLV